MKYIYLIFLFFTTICYPSKQNQNNFSRDSTISILNKKLEISNSNEKELKKLNDDLKNQVTIYMAKEDYFAAALGDQSNRFVLIVSILVASLALISFSWYKTEQKKINGKFKKFKVEFENLKTENKKVESKLHATSGNAFASIALTAKKDEFHVSALEFYICAARDFYISDTLKEKTNYTTSITNLKFAKTTLEEITKKEDLKEKLTNKKENIFKNLEQLQKCEDDSIIEYVVLIKKDINDFIQNK